MPTYKGVEVWIEDSQHRKLNRQEVSIDLVDDRTVTAKTKMSKDELYTVHCLSPISVFCDVFVISTTSRIRKRAARFHLNKALATSKDASGSSVDHVEGGFRDHGLRTPKRTFEKGEYNPLTTRKLCTLVGKLGSVEVEIRRIGETLKGEQCEADGGEVGAIEFSMIDDFDQPPWLVFRFDIGVKESQAAPASTAEHIRRRVPHRILKNRSQATSGSQPKSSNTEGSSNAAFRERGNGYSHNSEKHPKHNGPVSIGEDPIHANSDRLQQEYQKQEVEERRLLRKLQERLQAKKARNMELRRLLGETP